jgi:hypothetical protein
MYIKLFEDFAKEVNERKQYTILDVTVDGNPVIQFTNLTSRNKWLEQNSNDVIDDPRAYGTVLDADQKKIVGSSRGPYWVVVKKAALKEDETQDLNENVYPQGKGGPIEKSLRAEEVGRLDLKYKGDIIGTLLVWIRPNYIFGGGGSYDESKWEYGASYTAYPLSGGGRFNDGSSGTGVWSGDRKLPKDEAIKACKDFLKSVKLS